MSYPRRECSWRSPVTLHVLGAALCVLGAALVVLEVERWTGCLVAGLVLLYLGTMVTVAVAVIRMLGR